MSGCGNEANVWRPRKILDIDADNKSVSERIVSLQDQSTFYITEFAYVLGTGALTVYKNGLRLNIGVDWVEQTTTSFSTVVACDAGDVLTAVGMVGIEGTVDSTSYSEEAVVLEDGQTTVQFPTSDLTTSAIYIGTTSVDRGRLIAAVDYTVTNTGTGLGQTATIELTSSYPAGTYCVAVAIDVVGSTELDTVKRLTLAEAVASTTAREGDIVIISDRGNGLFEYEPRQTSNSRIIDCDIPTLSLVLSTSFDVYPEQWGLLAGSNGANNSDVLDDVIAYLRTLPFGGRINYPAWEFEVDRSIPLYSYIQHVGLGMGNTVIKASSVNDDNVIGNSGMEFDIPSAWNVIKNLTVDGNKTNVAYNTRFGGFADDAYQNGIRLFKTTDYTIEDVEVRNTVFNGISVYFSSNRGRIIRPVVHDIGKADTVPVGGFASYMGIFVEYACNDLIIDTPRIYTGREIGIMLQMATDGSIFDVTIINPQISQIVDQGIAIRDQGAGTTGDVYDVTIIGGELRNCCTGGVTTSQAAYRVERQTVGRYCSNIKMIGTTISDSGYIGALLNTGAKNCVMQGVTVKGSGNKGIIDAGELNELNACQSFLNTGVNLDKVAAVGNRTIGGFYEYGAEDGQSGFFYPTLNFGGVSSGSGTIVGNYKVNGNVVFFDLRILLSSKGAEVGDVSIEGMPFQAKSDALPPVTLVASNLTYGGVLACLILNGTTNVFLYEQTSGGALSRLNNGNFADNTELYLSGSYLAEL